MIETFDLPRPAHGARHDHMLRRFSMRLSLIDGLRGCGVSQPDAEMLVHAVTAELGVAPPAVTFHRGRGPHTGYCQMPRSRAVARSGEGPVTRWETSKGRDWPQNGMIRLGDPTTVATVAHELGHHLVNVLDAVNTPPHGKAWVARFDQAVVIAARMVGRSEGAWQDEAAARLR